MDIEQQVEHRRIVVDGVVHHYVTAGAGRPLVLIHGFPQTWWQWREVMARLTDGFQLIVPDLRGLGGTPGPATGYDKHTLAADVRAIVEAECGDQPVLLCGHDMGAYVAFAYALDNRDSVGGVVLVDAPPPGTSFMDRLVTFPRVWHVAFHANVDVAHMLISGRERAYVRQFVMTRIYDVSAISEEDIDRYAAAYAAPGALRSGLELYRALPVDRELNLAALAEGGKLAMPVIAVASGMTAAPRDLDEMVDEIALNGEVVIVDRSGHWIPEEQPDRMAKVILDLAARSSSP